MKFSALSVLILGLLLLVCCSPMPEANTETEPSIAHHHDTLRQPSIADSIQLWIVPNHMLWVPLEFESTHAVDRAEKKY